MTSLAVVLVAPALLGVDFGWQPVAGTGGIEFMIRLSAEQIESLANGEDVLSDLPPNMEAVHTYRITTDPEKLPNEGIPPRAKITTLSGVSTGSPSNANLIPGAVPLASSTPSSGPPGTTFSGGSTPNYLPPSSYFTPPGGFTNSGGSYYPPQSQSTMPGSNWNHAPTSSPSIHSNYQPQGTYQPSSNYVPNSGPLPGIPATPAVSATVVQEKSPSTWIATIVALGLSLGANCYLGLLSVSLYNRCRVLLGQLRFASWRG